MVRAPQRPTVSFDWSRTAGPEGTRRARVRDAVRIQATLGQVSLVKLREQRLRRLHGPTASLLRAAAAGSGGSRDSTSWRTGAFAVQPGIGRAPSPGRRKPPRPGFCFCPTQGRLRMWHDAEDPSFLRRKPAGEAALRCGPAPGGCRQLTRRLTARGKLGANPRLSLCLVPYARQREPAVAGMGQAQGKTRPKGCGCRLALTVGRRASVQRRRR